MCLSKFNLSQKKNYGVMDTLNKSKTVQKVAVVERYPLVEIRLYLDV